MFGVGSLLLPVFNLQFRLMEFLDAYQPVAGIVIAAIGAALLFLAMRNKPAAAPAAAPQSTPPPSV
ncbi:MAG TPA: hypothetical protein VJ850_02375 [Candidatus Limnocylindrales bacterium]|nr:hypothetical protein [Candidatus Limnocylindrales bacterium]